MRLCAMHGAEYFDVRSDEYVFVLNNNVPGAEGGEGCIGDALGDSVFFFPRSAANPVKDNPVL